MALPADTHPVIRTKLESLLDKANEHGQELHEEVVLLLETVKAGTDYHGVCNRAHAIMRQATSLFYVAGAIAVLRHLPYDFREQDKE